MRARLTRDYQRHITAEGRPKSLDSGGFTPLLYAARENCLACIDVLLEQGADIDLAGSGRRLAAAPCRHERELGSREALDRSRRRRQPVGYLRRSTAVHRGRQLHETDGGRASIDPPNETEGIAVVRMLLERGANPNMQLFFRPANVRGPTNRAARRR